MTCTTKLDIYITIASHKRNRVCEMCIILLISQGVDQVEVYIFFSSSVQETELVLKRELGLEGASQMDTSSSHLPPVPQRYTLLSLSFSFSLPFTD